MRAATLRVSSIRPSTVVDHLFGLCRQDIAVAAQAMRGAEGQREVQRDGLVRSLRQRLQRQPIAFQLRRQLHLDRLCRTRTRRIGMSRASAHHVHRPPPACTRCGDARGMDMGRAEWQPHE
jgi:hypothetical protein